MSPAPTVLLVSIPQGTIKRHYGGYSTALQIQFQFHKVRLKVLVTEVTVNAAMFQFHKVRLKGANYSHVNIFYLVSIPQGTIKSF